MAGSGQTKKAGADLPKLAAPALRTLAGARILRLSDLEAFTEADLPAVHGMGPNAMAAIRAAMKANRLSFAKR